MFQNFILKLSLKNNMYLPLNKNILIKLINKNFDRILRINPNYLNV